MRRPSLKAPARSGTTASAASQQADSIGILVESQTHAATTPPRRVVRAISRTPVARSCISGTTSCASTTSKLPSSNGNRSAVPTRTSAPAKWTYYYLYVVLDVYSRYTVGWTVQHRESGQLAKELIAQACQQQQIAREQLTIHADRGSSMTSKPVAFLLADLGVTKTHNRPYTSTDNPYSEAQFKTLTYRPKFPARCVTHRRRPRCPPPRGSTSPPTTRRLLTNFNAQVSHPT